MPSQRPVIGYLAELERQAWDDEGREKDRQKALPGASEGDGLALGGLEGPSSAGVSATADLQGVTSGFDWYLDRVTQYATSTPEKGIVMSSSDKVTTLIHNEQGERNGLRNRPNEPAMTGRPEVGGARATAQVSLWQLNLLRVGYLVMGGGLAVVKWPLLINHGPGS